MSYKSALPTELHLNGTKEQLSFLNERLKIYQSTLSYVEAQKW